MSKTRNEDDEDPIFKASGLHDGQHLRVPMKMADAARAARDSTAFPRPANGDTFITDRAGGTLGLHRPGFRVETGGRAVAKELRDGDAQDAQDARAEYEADLTKAWKTPPAKSRDAIGEIDEQEGDPCTVKNREYVDDFGSPGTLCDDGTGNLVCVPNRLVRSRAEAADKRVADHEDRMGRLYDQYDRTLTNAWRGGK